MITNSRLFEEVKSVAYVSMGVLFLGALSQITIPLKPIPITMQTVAVLSLGLFYDRKEAIRSVVGYIALGTMLPLFPGYAYAGSKLLGPAGGYYLGFVLCAYAMGRLKGLIRSRMALCLIGQACIYAVGVPWLAAFVGLKAALVEGMLVFAPSGLVKGMLLGYLCKKLSRR